MQLWATYPNLPRAGVLLLLYSGNSKSVPLEKSGRRSSSTDCFSECVISPFIPTKMSNSGFSRLGMKLLKDKKKIKLKTDSNVEKTYQPNNISKFIKIYTY